LLHDKRLHVIFGITLTAMLGVSSLTPAFPKIAQSLRLTEVQVSYLISVFTLPGIFLTPVAGILADRYGRKAVLTPSLFLFGLAGFACFFSRNFFWLLFFRFFQGIGASALGSLNITLIGDFFQGKQRAAAMGYNASVLSIGLAIFPFVGGLLAEIAWYEPFALPLIALPVGLAVIFSIKSPHIKNSQKLSVYFSNVWKSVRTKEALGLFSLSILTFVILYGAFLSYFPFLLTSKFNLSPFQIGIFFSISSLSTAITSSQLGRLVGRFSEVNLIKWAYGLYIAVGLMMPFINTLYFYIVPMVMFGVAQGINIPSLQTLLVRLAPTEQRALFMSVNGMVLRIGQTLGPLFIGLGFAISGISGVFYLAAFVAACMLVLVFLMLKGLTKNEFS